MSVSATAAFGTKLCLDNSGRSSFRSASRRQSLIVRKSAERVVFPMVPPPVVQREVLTPSERTKLDIADDVTFYDQPRLVHHTDEAFRRKVTQLYKQQIPANGAVLDLMSSWVSHLPNDVNYSLVVGHGMNAQELKKNRRLDRFFVRDFNRDPKKWSEQANTFDAVICCASVQYLQQPECVFAEILRVLKPDGVCIMTFSNRLFYSKAIQAWRNNSNFGRVSLIKQYFNCVQGFTEPEVVKEMALPSEKFTGFAAVQANIKNILNVASQKDPFYAVLAHKK